MSAIFGALTVLVAYNATLYITKNYVISIFTPLTILTSQNFILESSKAEVYSLNTFLIMLVFYLGLRTIKDRDFLKKVLLSSFILGLGMGNHHIIGFMLIPILYVVIIKRKELPFGTIALSTVLFIAGFSIYFYLYLRTLANTFINYSPVYSFIDFLTVFFRTAYKGNTILAVEGISHHSANWFYSIRNVGLILSKETHPLIWFFVLLGMIGIFKDRKIFSYILISVLIWIILGKMTIGAKEPTYNDLFIISPYFLQLVPIFGVIAGAGLFKCYEKIRTHSAFISKTVVMALILFQVVYVAISIQKSSLSDYFIGYNWIKDISRVLKPKSFYLAFGDNPGFLGFYGFGVERLRDDVLFMDAATGHNTFRLILSPQWKFDIWYPEFYKTQGTSVKYFYPIAKEGRLYASMMGSIPKNIKDKFDTRWYVLLSILLPKDNDFPFKERFKDDFKKIDYLPIVTGYKTDILATEILKNYALTIWGYANLLAEENAKDTDYFYKLTIFMGNKVLRNEVIKEYIKFLVDKRGVEEAQKFISEIKDAVSDADIEMKKGIENIENWYKSRIPNL